MRLTYAKESFAAVGVEMAKALVGLHNLSDADRIGKSKNMSEITSCSVSYALTEDAVHAQYKLAIDHLERFVCSVYSS